MPIEDRPRAVEMLCSCDSPASFEIEAKPCRRSCQRIPGSPERTTNRADAAKQATLEDRPDGFNDINTDLFASAQAYQDSFDKLVQYLDDQKPSEASDARDSSQEAANDLAQATHEARVKYRDLGGKPMELADLKTQHAA